MIDVRKYFLKLLSNSETYNDTVPLFVHVHFGPDKQKSYENNCGMLNYEVINSPFILFKFYLDVLGRIVLNQCTKYLSLDCLKMKMLMSVEILRSVYIGIVL